MNNRTTDLYLIVLLSLIALLFFVLWLIEVRRSKRDAIYVSNWLAMITFNEEEQEFAQVLITEAFDFMAERGITKVKQRWMSNLASAIKTFAANRERDDHLSSTLLAHVPLPQYMIDNAMNAIFEEHETNGGQNGPQSLVEAMSRSQMDSLPNLEDEVAKFEPLLPHLLVLGGYHIESLARECGSTPCFAEWVQRFKGEIELDASDEYLARLFDQSKDEFIRLACQEQADD